MSFHAQILIFCFQMSSSSTSLLYICWILCALSISLTVAFDIDDSVLSDNEIYPAIDDLLEDSKDDNLLTKILKYIDIKNGHSVESNGFSQKLYGNYLDQNPQFPVVNKRKVFWQPLGYIPASVRGTGSAKSQSSDNNGGQLFRYG